ncbi:hypothetical protein [Arcticibacter tournemirensis]
MTRNFAVPLFLSVLMLVNVTSLSAQDTTGKRVTPVTQAPVKLADPSLNGQYRDMLMRSRTQEGYKLVNPFRLTTLWKNTMDTLRAEKRKRIEAEQKLSSGMAGMSAMKDSLSKNKESLDQSLEMVNSISLFGIPVEKTVYNLVMWGLVLLLALALTIIVFLMGKYKREASYRIKLFEELSSEFQTYKIKANDREKKLARELQDERNKLDELSNRK